MTRATGRLAALPTPGYKAPRRLYLDDGQCLGRFFPESGGPPADFNFAAPVTSDPFGIHVNTAMEWALFAQDSWGDYLAARRDTE